MATRAETTVAAPGDRDIVFTRQFDAPPELVYRAWTEADRIAQWWGPEGFTTTNEVMDVRPGGEWRFVMHAPDGTPFDNIVTYHEVEPSELLVYSQGEPGDEEQFRVTVTFQRDGAQTELTMRIRFPSAEARDQKIKEVGALEGGNQTLDRLAEHLSNLS